MTSPVIMLDGVAADVPAIRAWMNAHGERPVAGYVSGGPGLEWSEAQFALFTRKVRIWQRPFRPGAARDARFIDVEPGAADAASVPEFLAERHTLGHEDGGFYSDISELENVLAEIGQAFPSPHETPPWRLWLAWYWGRRFSPTPAQVLAEIERQTGIVLPATRLWACQWKPAGFADFSVVYGTPDFSRR